MAATVFAENGYRYQVRRRKYLRDRDKWFECAVIERPTDENGKPYGYGVGTLIAFTETAIKKAMRNGR